MRRAVKIYNQTNEEFKLSFDTTEGEISFSIVDQEFETVFNKESIEHQEAVKILTRFKTIIDNTLNELN